MSKVLDIIAKYPTLLNKYGINTKLRKAHFFAQLEHESGLEPISENLNYSAKRLFEIFKKYFATMAIANVYAGHPKNIANRVYANRMGNGNEKSGDGYKYRGRGFIQITGKYNYTQLASDTDLDCINNPDLLLEEANALISALWFWEKNGLNQFADKDDINTITRRINGGLNGIEARKAALTKMKNLL